MSEDRDMGREGKSGMNPDDAALWRKARSGLADALGEEDELDPLLLAAYLDGGLEESEQAEFELRLAADPAALEQFLAARDALEAGPADMVPTSLMERAQGLVRADPPTAEAAGVGGWLSGFFGGFGQLGDGAAFAGFAIALIVASATGFELGQVSTENIIEVASPVEQDATFGLDDDVGQLL